MDLGGDAPERLNCARAEATFLPTLGVRPSFGARLSQKAAAPVTLDIAPG
jgi:hypothetical protein